MMSSQKGFWFPSMKFSEIVIALDEWGLRVSDDQIHRPTGEVVQSIYRVFLQQLRGLTMENLQESAMRSLQVVEYGHDLYDNSISLHLLLNSIAGIAQAARVMDFSMRDLVNPDPERTRSILSAMINYIKFCEEREDFIRKLQEQSTAALVERERIREQTAELKDKIEEIKRQRQRDASRCEQLRESNAKLTNDLIASKSAQTTLLNEFDALKKNRSALGAQKESLIKELEMTSNSITAIRSRIVQDPDGIKKQISQMVSESQIERNKVNAAETRTRDLKIKLDALGVFEQDLKKLVESLKSAAKEHIVIEDFNQKMQLVKSEVESKKIQRDDSLKQDERYKRQLKNAGEKLQRAKDIVKEKQTKSEARIKELKLKYETMSQERRENDKIVEETKQDADEVERKMSEHLKTSESELNELLAEYWNLRHQTDVYMETLANKLGIELS